MSAEFWRRVFESRRGMRFFAIPDSTLYLRAEIGARGEPLEAWISKINRVPRDERDTPRGGSQLRLFFRGNAITLKVPVEMSGQQWTPGGVLFGSTYEGGQSPRAMKAVPRDEWLDEALARMVAQFK
jgi:hypothetical protein